MVSHSRQDGTQVQRAVSDHSQQSVLARLQADQICLLLGPGDVQEGHGEIVHLLVDAGQVVIGDNSDPV